MWPVQHVMTVYPTVDCLPCLKTLTVRTLWDSFTTLEPFRNLKFFRALEGLDWRYKNILEEDQERLTMAVYFYKYAGPHQENLIVNTLNDDCLLHLVKFLPIQECIAFAGTHPRIDRIITRHRFPVLDTDDVQLAKVLRKNIHFGQRIVPYVRDLTLRGQPLTTHLLPHVRAVKNLTLDHFLLKDAINFKWPKTIEKLGLLNIFLGDADIKLLGPPLRALKHLKEVAFDPDCAPEIISNLFKQNRDTLQHINLQVNNDSNWNFFEIDWKVVETMKNFKHLTLKRNGNKGNSDDKTLLESALSQIGFKLYRLSMSCSIAGWDSALNVSNLANLQWLDLNVNCGLNELQLNAICSLKELHTLVLERSLSGAKYRDENIMQLIKSCGKLVFLKVAHFRSSVRFEEDLLAYLKGSGRSLDFK